MNVSNDMTARGFTDSNSCEPILKMLCWMDKKNGIRWVLQCLESPASRQFVHQFVLVYIKEVTKALHGPFVTGSPGDLWTSQRTSNAESVSK